MSKLNRKEVLSIIEDLVDEGECWYDHHGYCQEHGWCETNPPCPHARAKLLLAKFEGVNSDHSDTRAVESTAS